METFVFASKDLKELKKVLEGDTLSDDSFARLGYILRDGKPYGIEGYVVHFRADSSRAKVFAGKLLAIQGCTEVTGEPKKKVTDAVEAEENSATAGFGSLFG